MINQLEIINKFIEISQLVLLSFVCLFAEPIFRDLFSNILFDTFQIKFVGSIKKLNCKWLEKEATFDINMITSGEEEQEIKLPIYESNHSRSVNLNELIRLHRLRQKYQIVDKFFNNSYICIENKLLPNQTYYQHDMLRSYLQDLALVYFKDIEFSEYVRLQYVLRRLNFTLNGQNFDFKEFLSQNRLDSDMYSIFSDQYLESLGENSNEPHVISLRNSMYLCLIIKCLYTVKLQNYQIAYILQQINDLYNNIKNRMYSGHIDNQKEIRTKSATNHSGKQEQDSEDNQINDGKKEIQEQINNQKGDELVLYFEDMIYQEEISLKIIQVELQNYYFDNQLKDSINEQQYIKLKYLYEINREYLSKLNDLKQINNQNRMIFKRIKANIKRQMSSSTKCFVNHNSSNHKDNFGYNLYSSDFHSNESKKQRVLDAEYMQKTLIATINKLKHKQIADSIQKVYEIEKSQSKNAKVAGNLLFSISFQKGLGINQAILGQEQFLALNQLRQESLLTSYYTPMKSCYSFISHNIYTFLKLNENDFAYDRTTNNNQEVMKRIRNKISRHRNLGKTQIKQYYGQNFKICHNCKILCSKLFLKQCRKRVRNDKEWEDSNIQSVDDDSLYTDKNFKSKRNSLCSGQCQKNYCIYCIKNHFGGKLFNQRGWCPYCLEVCSCTTCLRERMLKKLIDLYQYVGGDPSKVKTQKQIVESLQIKSCEEQNDSIGQSNSVQYVQFDQRVYQNIIKKQIMKGFAAEEIEASLSQQKQIIAMVLRRENLKLKSLQFESSLFRKKISLYNVSYQYIDFEAKEQKRALQQEKKVRKERDRQEYNMKMLAKRRRSKRPVSKEDQRRKCKKIIRDEQIFYDYYRIDNEASGYEESSSFHINLNKSRQRNYQPYYTF